VPFFKANNPFNTFLIFIYALAIKFIWLIHPHGPEVKWIDGWLSPFLVPKIIDLLNSHPVFYSLIVYLLLITQALSINKIVNDQRMLQRANYLPAMAYLLITSFFAEWNQLSVILIVNTIIIMAWSKMNRLYNTQQSRTILFNIGMLTGIVSLLYFPGIFFGILLFFALSINRPFRSREWLVAIIGILTPYYLLLSILYLSDRMNIFWLPYLWPKEPILSLHNWALTVIIILLTAFAIGFYYVQTNLRRQVVQVRKSWYVMIIYLILSVLTPLFYSRGIWQYYLLTTIPISVYISSALFYPRKRWFPIVLHWLLVAFVIGFSYFNLK
jgi:hypothetical protein